MPQVNGQTIRAEGCGRAIGATITDMSFIALEASIAGQLSQTLGGWVACHPAWDGRAWNVVPAPPTSPNATVTATVIVTAGFPVPTVVITPYDNGVAQPPITVPNVALNTPIHESWQAPTGHQVRFQAQLSNGIGNPVTLTSQTVNT